MKKTKKTDSSFALQFVGLILFLCGLVALVFFPIGTIAGLIVMILVARMGYSRKKVWLCKNCGYFFERA